MKVLSLFDGVSGARLALDTLGIEVDRYYASEINEKAISVSKKNWPDIEHVGDINELSGYDPRFNDIDLVIAGSPCTNLSIAGNGLGLDGQQSKLFYEFIRLMKEIKPRNFLLENVASMKNSDRDLMTKVIREAMDRCYGTDRKGYKLRESSADYSAQGRKRLYWSTLPGSDLISPELRAMTVADIIETDVDVRFFLNTEQGLISSKKYESGDWYSDISPMKIFDIGKGRQGERIYSKYGKSVTVTAGGGGPGGKTGLYMVTGEYGEVTAENAMQHCRRLTPREAERLQYVPDDYTRYGHDESEMTNADRYEMMGNGFTITTIAWWLSGLLKESE